MSILVLQWVRAIIRPNSSCYKIPVETNRSTTSTNMEDYQR